MNGAKVLVADDDANIRELLTTSLKFQGYNVTAVADGPAALDSARSQRPDVLVLDVMMPGMDGFGVIKRLRADGIDSPVLFLTARDAVEDKINGLTIGADDYVTKPFSLEELVARLAAVLRRANALDSNQSASGKLRVGNLVLDDLSHQVLRGDDEILLSPTEFALLRYLMANSGVVLSKAKILDHVWNYDFGGDANIVESYISYLRKKIDVKEPRLIHTVRGVGYVVREPR